MSALPQPACPAPRIEEPAVTGSNYRVQDAPQIAQFRCQLAHGKLAEAARLATFEGVAPRRPPKTQITYIHKGVRLLAAKLQHQVDYAGDHDANYQLSLNMAKLALRMCHCRPAGGYFWRSGEMAKGAQQQSWVCGHPQFCPWCHYRKFEQLYREVAQFPGARWVLTSIMTHQKPYRRTRDGLRKCLTRGRAKGAWILTRPNLTHWSAGNYPGEIKILEAGVTQPTPTAFTRDITTVEVTKHLSVVQQDWLPRFYRYQPEVLAVHKKVMLDRLPLVRELMRGRYDLTTVRVSTAAEVAQYADYNSLTDNDLP